MFKYALAEELIEKNPTELLKINIEDDDEHGVPFTDEDLKILWKNKTNDIAEVLLIMCYTGFRRHVQAKKESYPYILPYFQLYAVESKNTAF